MDTVMVVFIEGQNSCLCSDIVAKYNPGRSVPDFHLSAPLDLALNYP